MKTIPTFACTSWEGDHLLVHVALPFNQTQPPPGAVAWGATKCDRAMRLNGRAKNAAECLVCFGEAA